MPNYENESDCKVKSKTHEKKLYYKHESITTDSDKEMEGSANGSQNFCLKLSQDSAISDTQDTVEKHGKEVIVISDSSSDCFSPKCFPEPKLKMKSNKQFIANKEVCILDSSDSDCPDTESERFFQAWRVNKKHNYISHNPTKKSAINVNNGMYTSDETSSNSSEQSKRFIQSSNKTSSSYVGCTSENNVKAISKTKPQIQTNSGNGSDMLSSCAASTSSTKSSKSLYPSSKTSSTNDKHRSIITKKITRKDAQNIMKNIKATKIQYESPRRENNVIIDESVDSDIHPAISLKGNLKKSNKIISDTPEDFESDVIESSQVNVTNPNRNYSNKLLPAPDVKRDLKIPSAELSERKKRQISQWLMANSPDSKSDSSFSIVPASSKGEISSGNSSLERLEMNYETPNNRGKIHHTPMRDKRITNQTCNTVSRQITLHEFTQRAENNVLELRTLIGNHTTKTTVSTAATNAPQKVDVMDCADILDKLYGKSWREKADVLLPRSEPRKQGIPIKSRGIQTERKEITKHKFYVADSDDDDSNIFSKDLRLQKYSAKTTERKNSKQIDSFINDQESSGSGSDSLYYTALTNPRISRNGEKLKTPLSSNTQRAIAICDSDTESEADKSNSSPVHDIRRRKLSFSNDDSENSSTSEFDPGDYVPPRPTVTKDPSKTSYQTSKINTGRKITSNKQQHGFLASLSEGVPIANAHPDAKKYRIDFKSSKEALCNYLFKLYNEKVFDKKLPEDLSIEWNIRMRGTAGFCYNKKSLKTLGGVVKSSRIVLATKVLDTPDRLRDTLIHEMCHAAAWLINSVSDGHGPFWTGWANKAMKTFPELPPIRRCHDYKIKTKFTYRCVGCGYSIGRHSKSLDIERKRCGHCYGKFELLLNKTTKAGTVQVQTPKREPTGFALYVKQNYNFVKKERNMRHAEVMKTLGIGMRILE
ncbi:uncharacterized protein LOC143373319 isoform X2 [Andrena cerasifolii]|uniref:uncharacterized protein LOC143373319 isoform X2 n=1 Tax=Andrena cerasifolii TaxID=2819439 RepID=UPI0040380961